MIQNKKLILTALLTITLCGNDTFGMQREVDRPSNTVVGAAPSARPARRADIIDFDTGQSLLLTHVNLGRDTWANDVQTTCATNRIQNCLDTLHIDASQVTRVPFSPQVLERPEFARWRDDILKASVTPKITYSSSSSYNRSSSSTTTINGRTVAQGGRKTSTSSSKAKVIKCADGSAVVIFEANSEARGPGDIYNASGSSRTSVVRTDKVTPEYLTKLGIQPSNVAWETSPDSSDSVYTQSFLRDLPAFMGNATPSRTPRVHTPSSAKPVVRDTQLRPVVAASTPKPQAGRRGEAMKSSVPARAALQQARPQRSMTAPNAARRVGVSPSREAGAMPVRIANRTPQSAPRSAALPLTRPTNATVRLQARQPVPVASLRRVSVVPQRKPISSAPRQAPSRNTSLRPALRTPGTGTRPNNSRLPPRR